MKSEHALKKAFQYPAYWWYPYKLYTQFTFPTSIIGNTGVSLFTSVKITVKVSLHTHGLVINVSDIAFYNSN